MPEATTEAPVVRDINVPGHSIKIRFKCYRCGRIRGRVFKDGKKDKEDVYYQNSLILFLAGDENILPVDLCTRCRNETKN